MSAPYLPKLWSDLCLRPFLGEVNRRHGYIETLALPSMRDLPPIRIKNLFVSPALATRPASADSDPATWPSGVGLYEALQASPQLVVLGEPGCGKTTLANWLVWRISAGLVAPLPKLLEERVPLPCILREMPSDLFTVDTSLPDLAQFLAERLLGDKADGALIASLRARVAAGHYMLVLDGIDEIAVTHRKIVAGWLRQANQDNACALATSRLVGYDDYPVDSEKRDLAKGSERALSMQMLSEPKLEDNYLIIMKRPGESRCEDEPKPNEQRWAQLRYLLPFDQQRIAIFVENWYHQRCGTKQEALQKTGDLLVQINKSDVTQRLARTPNLLSLMAIVFREHAHLPDGKALLYDEIVNAYINTIDQQRKILPGDALAPYAWKERRAWLAYVGFQMQLHRGTQIKTEAETGSQQGVLVEEAQVRSWLAEAMQITGVEQPEKTAAEFLHWVARRCGLLLPRGEGRYAFVHLSFQEYFCACYLFERIDSPAYMRDRLPKDALVTRSKLTTWGEFSTWRETLVYLFEILSSEHGIEWVDDLAATLFGDLEEDGDLHGSQAELAGRALADRHIRLGRKWKDKLAGRCSMAAFSEQYSEKRPVFSALVEAGYAARELPSKDEKPQKAFEDFAENRLRVLVFAEKENVDVARLAGMDNLRVLSLENTNVDDVAPLAGLDNLRVLSLKNTNVDDVTPLAGLKNLQALDLDNTRVALVEPLAELKNLQHLCLNHTRVALVEPLAKLKNLQVLELNNTQVKLVAPLARLENLRHLELNYTRVADVAPLVGLKQLTVWLNGKLIEPAKTHR